MTELELRQLSYALLSGRSEARDPLGELHDKAYSHWKAFWTAVYSQAGSLEAFIKEDFTRQDHVSIISHKGDIVALHAHSTFDLERLSTLDHRYFAFFSDNYLTKIKSRGVRSVQTFEFLSVHPDWGRKRTQIPLAEVIIGLGLKLMRLRGIDAAVASARSDVKVPQMAAKWGFVVLESGVMRRNFPCDLIACFSDDIRNHPSPDVALLTERLWSNRIESGTTSAPSRRAA